MTLRVVRSGAETNGELLELEATYEPGSVEPLEHFHPSQEEHFEIIDGTMQARVDGGPRTLTRGDQLDIPARTVHAMWNGGSEPARVLWQTRPALRTEEFLGLVARLAEQGKLTSAGARDPLLGAAVMNEYRAEFRPTKPPAAVQAVAFPPLAAVARVLGRRP
jgi:mannose-6-phosphate isomerase-like protein (cupin superfamily)